MVPEWREDHVPISSCGRQHDDPFLDLSTIYVQVFARNVLGNPTREGLSTHFECVKEDHALVVGTAF